MYCISLYCYLQELTCAFGDSDRAMLWLGPVPEDKLPKDVQGECHGSLSGVVSGVAASLFSSGARDMLWLRRWCGVAGYGVAGHKMRLCWS
jgi:hypothetical protein